MNYRVTCITKPHRDSPHEAITRLGGTAPNGTGWNDTKEKVISLIESKQHTFYTSTNGRTAFVGVVKGDGNKAPYLRTHADGSYNNNLLSLLECVS